MTGKGGSEGGSEGKGKCDSDGDNVGGPQEQSRGQRANSTGDGEGDKRVAVGATARAAARATVAGSNRSSPDGGGQMRWASLVAVMAKRRATKRAARGRPTGREDSVCENRWLMLEETPAARCGSCQGGRSARPISANQRRNLMPLAGLDLERNGQIQRAMARATKRVAVGAIAWAAARATAAGNSRSSPDGDG